MKRKKKELRQTVQGVLDGTLFNISIALLIILSVVLLFLEVVLPAGLDGDEIHELSQYITVLFAIELLLRFYVAPNKRIYFTKYWLDILAVLPIFRFFRAFRIFRIFRLFTLYRSCLNALKSIGWIQPRTVIQIERFMAIMMGAMMIILTGTLSLLMVERDAMVTGSTAPIPDEKVMELFWTSVYLFTSGEVAFTLPTSDVGRLVGSLISISGVVVFALLVSTMSASMITFLKGRMDKKDLTIKDLNEHVVICGWDNVGIQLLEELEESQTVWRRGVVIVSSKEIDFAKETHIRDHRRLFHIQEDFTQIETLEKAGVKNAKTAIVLSEQGNSKNDQDRDARTVLAALTIEKLNNKIHTCAELLNPQNASHLKLAGVEEIISRNQLTAGLLASSAVNEGVTYVISDILTHLQGSYLNKTQVPSEFVGCSFHELVSKFKKDYDALVVGLEIEDKQMLNPNSDFVIPSGAKATMILKKDSQICTLKE